MALAQPHKRQLSQPGPAPLGPQPSQPNTAMAGICLPRRPRAAMAQEPEPGLSNTHLLSQWSLGGEIQAQQSRGASPESLRGKLVFWLL